MSKQEKADLIYELSYGVKQCEAAKIDMDSTSWGYEEGVLLSGNQAKELLLILEENKS